MCFCCSASIPHTAWLENMWHSLKVHLMANWWLKRPHQINHECSPCLHSLITVNDQLFSLYMWYLLADPLHAMRSWMQTGHQQTHLLSSLVLLCRACMDSSSLPARFRGFFFFCLLSDLQHVNCLAGLRSGDWLGSSETFHSLALKKKRKEKKNSFVFMSTCMQLYVWDAARALNTGRTTVLYVSEGHSSDPMRWSRKKRTKTEPNAALWPAEVTPRQHRRFHSTRPDANCVRAWDRQKERERGETDVL